MSMLCFVGSRQLLFRIALVRIVRRFVNDQEVIFGIAVFGCTVLVVAVGDRGSIFDVSDDSACGVVAAGDRGSILDRNLDLADGVSAVSDYGSILYRVSDSADGVDLADGVAAVGGYGSVLDRGSDSADLACSHAVMFFVARDSTEAHGG